MVSEEPLFRLRNVACDFESLRRAIIDMAAPTSMRREMVGDQSLFLERFVVERGGSRLDLGRIRLEGGKDAVVRKLALPQERAAGSSTGPSGSRAFPKG